MSRILKDKERYAKGRHPREKQKLVQRPHIVGCPGNKEKEGEVVWRCVQREWRKDRIITEEEAGKISQQLMVKGFIC